MYVCGVWARGVQDEGAVKAGNCRCTSNPHGAARSVANESPGPPFSRVFFALNALLCVIKTGEGIRGIDEEDRGCKSEKTWKKDAKPHPLKPSTVHSPR